jgi:EpsI family protein
MKRAPLVTAILILAATVVLDWVVPVPGEHPPQGERISRRIPSVLGDWSLKRDLPVGEDEKRILGTDDILHRLYARDSGKEEVLLTLVFSSGHRHSMHPPEVCYQSSGYTLVSRGTTQLEPSCEATMLRIAEGGDNQLVNYWFYSEGKETSSYIRHQIHLVIDQILFRSEPSVLIRLSTEIENADMDGAQSRLLNFGREAIPILREKLPAVAHEGAKAG